MVEIKLFHRHKCWNCWWNDKVDVTYETDSETSTCPICGETVVSKLCYFKLIKITK